MDYKKHIIKLVNKINDEKVLKRIYSLVNYLFVRS